MKNPTTFVFCQKPSSDSNIFIFRVETDWSCTKSGPTRHGFLQKRRPLEPSFRKLPTMPPRKISSLQLSCFKFFQIRPLRAQNCLSRKLASFTRIDSFLLKSIFTFNYTHRTSTGLNRKPTTIMQCFLT